MSKLREVSVTLVRVERVRNSADGNPRYKFLTSAGEFKTAPDTSAAFNMQLAQDEDLMVPVTFTLDARGGVISWELSRGE